MSDWTELWVETPYDRYQWKKEHVPPDRLCKTCGLPTQEFVLLEKDGTKRILGWKCIWCGKTINAPKNP